MQNGIGKPGIFQYPFVITNHSIDKHIKKAKKEGYNPTVG